MQNKHLIKFFRKIGILCTFAFLILLYLNNTAFAGYISFNTNLTSKVENNTLIINGSAVNKGNESAYNVRIEIKAQDKSLITKKITEVGINKEYIINEKLNLNPVKPGTYPLIAAIHYTDANQYPFAALICQTFNYKKESIPSLFGQLKSISLSKEEKISLKIKNLGNTELKTKVYLLTPRELSVKNQVQYINMPPRGEKDIEFQIKNFSALNNSIYQIYAVLETENDTEHSTNITPSTVKILETNIIFGINYMYIIILLIALIVIFISLQFYKKK